MIAAIGRRIGCPAGVVRRSLGGAAAPVTIATLPNKLLWLKADELALSNGAAVASFPDASPTGAVFVQATAGSRPTYQTPIQNGFGGVSFPDASDYLADAAFTAFNALAALSASFVAEFDFDTGTNYILFGAANLALVLQTATDSNVNIYAGTGKLGTFAAPADGFHCIQVIFDGAATGNANRLRVWVDDVQQTLAFTGTIPAVTESATGMTLGALGAGIQPFKGSLEEAVFCGAVWSDSTRQAVHEEMQAKWLLKSAAFGDSITHGTTGPSDLAHSYASLLASARSLNLINYAVDGSMVNDQIQYLYAHSVAQNQPVSWVALGANDQRIHGINSTRLAAFRKGIACALAYRALPDAKKVLGINAITSGTWGANAAWPGAAIGRYSREVGATLTATVTGSTVYIGSILQNSNVASFSVTIDGVAKGTFSSNPGSTITSYLGRVYMPQLLRFTGLALGAHTVVVTVESAPDISDAVYVDWIGAVRGSDVTPIVLAGGVTSSTAAGYAANGGSQANVDAYNVEISAVAGELTGDGLDVRFVDNSGIDPDTYTSDGLHLNDAGNVLMKDNFSAAF